MKTKAERIAELHETGVPLFTARRIVEQQDVEIAIDAAETIDDVKSVLRALNGR